MGIQGKRKIDDQAIMEKMGISEENLDSIRKRTIDYLLNGFKHSKRIALLVEPLNEKNFELKLLVSA